jgi:iron complex transport system substrate-binding protein
VVKNGNLKLMNLEGNNNKYSLCRILISGCFYGILFFLLIFQFCTDNREKQLKSDRTGYGEIEIIYARGFDIEDYNSYRIVRIFDPWQKLNGKSVTYLLVNNNSALPDSIKYDIRIDIPVHRIICMSTTHVAMINALGKLETIKGISGKQYINNEKIINGVMEGKIKDVGYEQNLNYELILSLNPDLIIMYGVTGEVTGILNRLTSLDIPVMLNAEYLETSPLAKMEWIKLIACLYNELELATDIFQEAETKYNELANLTEGIDIKPEVLSGLPWKNTWWIPGGQSFASAFIQDAGGKYIWEDDSSREAIPLDIETVYDCASQADIWINSGDAGTLNDILNTDQRLQYFRPYTEKRIYNNNARLNLSGGNDYWESGVINPHIILKDLIHIFHPDIIPDHQLVYYKKLE